MPEIRQRRLIDIFRHRRRVCPKHIPWERLWETLPDRRRKQNGGWDPPAPLILAAWGISSNDQKRDRFALHIRWAAQRGAFRLVYDFVHRLHEAEWHHADDDEDDVEGSIETS